MTRYLIDTNVLLRSAVDTSARNPAAAGAIAILLARGDEMLLAPQVLMEFWCVATRPAAANGFGWPVDVVRGEIDRLLDQFPLLSETAEVFGEWLRLVTKHKVTGKQVHDTRLVAILNTHQVARLLTFNTDDFKVFGAIAISPDEIVAD
ncbi:MAG: PIN domain-containing protein [Thermoguttaceae bacterium]|jgi:predicted nucleic acid-binding protein